jgi:hypothetical protein
LAETVRPTGLLKLHWIPRKPEYRRVQTMSEFDSRISQHILSLLEGEKIRVILRDGTIVEGAVVRVSSDELYLTSQVIALDQVATYYVLKEE